MPDVRPFRGIRYSSTSDLPRLVCPPYDVISAEEQERLHEVHPHNAVHLELARGGSGRYQETARTFRLWSESGVLERDEEPSLYVYRQDFVAPDGRRCQVAGVMGALALEPLGNGVLPHERTMAGPKRDRLELLRALPVNLSPIYGIYRGGGALQGLLDAVGERSPEAALVDAEGVRHRLWTVSAPGDVSALCSALAPVPLVIADGHHRYETALAFHRENAGRPGAHDAIMAFCVDADAADLVVLPYHRLLRGPETPEQLGRRLEELFGATRVPWDRAREKQKASRAPAFVFVLPHAVYLVEVPDEPGAGGASSLDVVVLHERILPRLFEQAPEIGFSKDAPEVVSLVDRGEWRAGVVLRPLDARTIVDVARSRQRMPQKASYFWPKVLTGLVFRSLE